MRRQTSATPFSSGLIEPLESRRLCAAITVNGTASADTILISSNGTVVTASVNGTTTNYSSVTAITVNAGSGSDYVEIGTNITRPATLAGNAGADTLLSGSGSDVLTGGDGNDLLNGRDGNDTVFGNLGADSIYGGNGADDLYQNGSTNSPDNSIDQFYPGDGDDVFGSFTSDGDVVNI
ncbi:MAG TPA: hypothetical protein VF595_12615 [Tepidisphaeraceae bacterium]|jgi:Ca2+-binding RTX toxin-like protein